MQTLIHADIFFFVTTICVVFISIAIIFLAVRLAIFVKKITVMAEELRGKAGAIGEEAEEILEQIKDSFIFRLFFGAKKRKAAKKAKLRNRQS